MNRRTYMVLGQDDNETNRGILIRVKNAGALARSQGPLGAFGQAIAPATVEKRVIDAVRDKIAAHLADDHVDADVTLVEPTEFRAANGVSHIARDVGLGIMALGGVALLWRLFAGKGDRR